MIPEAAPDYKEAGRIPRMSGDDPIDSRIIVSIS